ncbi:MAG TPA: hypothetical protein PKA06_13145 [Gemmatales bacterium]|nr:hypothetical protein [Gemmatales bacterium]HMP17826.1 hypothetical protein [Gemmatales bacterium]
MFGPTGPGGGAPLSGWTGSGGVGDYTINLSFVSAVPVPGGMLLAGIGIVALALFSRYKGRLLKSA